MNVNKENKVSAENKAASYWLLISQFIYIMLLPPWLFAAAMSMPIFAAGFGTNALHWLFLILFSIVLSYPVWMIIFSFMSWMYLNEKNYKKAKLFTSVPILITIFTVGILSIIGVMG